MPQNSNVVFVVGDRFHEFRKEKSNIILISEYWSLLNSDPANESRKLYVAGQGLSESEGIVFERSLTAVNRAFLRESSLGLQSKSKLTHKRKAENVIISTPELVDSENFVSQLLIDDDCAEMTDHCTGQHIQGMVLMEAGRQMFIAVTETHFAEVFPSPSAYFVINDFETKFGAFAFPLPLKINYAIVSKNIRPGRAVSFAAKMELVQCGKIVCEVKTQFSVHDSTVLNEKEQQKARAALEDKIEILRASQRESLGVNYNVG